MCSSDLGISTILNMVTLKNPYLDYKEKGYSYFHLGTAMPPCGGFADFNSSCINMINSKDKFEFASGLIYQNVKYHFPSREFITGFIRFVSQLSQAEKGKFYEVLGVAIGEGVSEKYKETDTDLISEFRAMIFEFEKVGYEKNKFYYGIGKGAGKMYFENKRRFLLLMTLLKQNDLF